MTLTKQTNRSSVYSTNGSPRTNSSCVKSKKSIYTRNFSIQSFVFSQVFLLSVLSFYFFLVFFFLSFFLSFFLRFRHRTLVKEYENTISNLETKSAQQTREIEELRQRADQCTYTVNHQSANISLDTDDISLKNRIDELLSIQQEERKKYEQAEQSITELKSRCEHYECYVQVRSESLTTFLSAKIKKCLRLIVNHNFVKCNLFLSTGYQRTIGRERSNFGRNTRRTCLETLRGGIASNRSYP